MGLFGRGKARKEKSARKARQAEAARQQEIKNSLAGLRSEYGEIDPAMQRELDAINQQLDTTWRGSASGISQAEVFAYADQHGQTISSRQKPSVREAIRQTLWANKVGQRDIYMKATDQARNAGARRSEGLKQFRQEYTGLYGDQLDDQFAGASRADKFLGANRGNLGGSAARVHSKRRLSEFLTGKQSIAANASKAVNEITERDQDQRLDLENRVRGGLASIDAISEAQRGAKASLDNARGQIGSQGLGQFFTSAGNNYGVYKEAEDAEKRRSFYSSRPSNGAASGSITRAGG